MCVVAVDRLKHHRQKGGKGGKDDREAEAEAAPEYEGKVIDAKEFTPVTKKVKPATFKVHAIGAEHSTAWFTRRSLFQECRSVCPLLSES